jgi:hypothetical protein
MVIGLGGCPGGRCPDAYATPGVYEIVGEDWLVEGTLTVSEDQSYTIRYVRLEDAVEVVLCYDPACAEPPRDP